MYIIEHLSDLLAEVKNKNSKRILISEIVDMLGTHGFEPLLMVFSVLLLIPSPPGVTSILGTPLLILTTQQILGYKRPVFPKWALKKSISTSSMLKMINYSISLAQKAKKFSDSRTVLLTNEGWKSVSMIASFISAVSIVLPIPFGNFLPAAGILLMAFASANKDGLLSLIGFITSLIGILISAGVVFAFLFGIGILATAGTLI